MITVRTRRGIVLLALLCVLAFWLSSQRDRAERGPIVGLDTRLDYALSDFSMLGYDEAGLPAIRITAPRLANDATTGIGRIEDPRVEVRHQGRQWNMIADTAVVDDDQEIVQLEGPVTVTRRSELARDRIDIVTADVTLEVTPRIARSSRRVQVTDAAGTLTARGFELDMIEERVRLMSEVEGVYVLP